MACPGSITAQNSAAVDSERPVAYLWGGMSRPTHTLPKSGARLTQRRFRILQLRVRHGLGATREGVRRLAARIRKVETTLDPLVDHVAFAEDKLRDLGARMTRLERRAAQRARRGRPS